MKRIIFAAFIFILILLCLPVSAAAELRVGPGQNYETLEDAVQGAASGDTIIVTENLTMTKRAYISDKHLIIQGADPTITITRGAGFSPVQDNARSTFNPGMLEVAVSDPGNLEETSSVTLKNIIFDDAGNPDSGIMTIMIPGGSNQYPNDWKNRIYDSILSAYDTKTTIVLGEGAQLKNPGGYSAIHITNGANCIVEENSVIQSGSNFNQNLILMYNNANLVFNTTLTDVTANNIVYAKNHVGNDGEFNIQFNGEVSGSGIHVKKIIAAENKGEIQFTGTISNIDNVMDGIQVHNGGYLNFTGTISKLTKAQSALNITAASVGSTLDFYGVVDGCNFSAKTDDGSAIRGYPKAQITMYEGSKVSNNTNCFAGAVYLRTSCVIDIYGEISNNTCSNDSGGGLYLIGSTGTLYDSGKIVGNKVTTAFKASGGGVFVNDDSKFIMEGGLISGNKATGTYTASKEGMLLGKSGQVYGGGGVSVCKDGQFIMNGGTIENNEAVVGGGVWISGRERANTGSSFIFNGGTIQNNVGTGVVGSNKNIHYGNDIAIFANNAAPSSQNTGHYVFVGENAVIGEKLIGVSQTNKSNTSNITGYKQAVYFDDGKNKELWLGTLKVNLEKEIIEGSPVSGNVAGYINTDSSLWAAVQPTVQTSGAVSMTTSLSDMNEDINNNEYEIIIASLDDKLDIQDAELIRPTRNSDVLSFDLPAADSASSYGIVILKKVKTDPLDLTISYEGSGEFYFKDYPDESVLTFNPGDTGVEIVAEAADGWFIESITLTAGDGSTFTKTVIDGVTDVDYCELADGSNNIHAVFVSSGSPEGPKEPGKGGGSSTGKATVTEEKSPGGFGSEEPETPGKPDKPDETDGIESIAPPVIVLLFMMAIATFLFVYKNEEE
ncbi:hypothetical protein MmiAt1_14690 [Methanimicrococcus sp. At1]|uniref:Uncharacterized protein n=1 Tax=Methanimicrococcus hacksteinii TaxID=3028293 RepID=A0ABU3VRD9_9EURY|nr:hypothetical protein [Methanimicrococcus sp. At1]MDV0445869.1 hypothetical protein [Methanimicrococcus sp. At1]